jgi:hypothetical protein
MSNNRKPEGVPPVSTHRTTPTHRKRAVAVAAAAVLGLGGLVLAGPASASTTPGEDSNFGDGTYLFFNNANAAEHQLGAYTDVYQCSSWILIDLSAVTGAGLNVAPGTSVQGGVYTVSTTVDGAKSTLWSWQTPPDGTLISTRDELEPFMPTDLGPGLINTSPERTFTPGEDIFDYSAFADQLAVFPSQTSWKAAGDGTGGTSTPPGAGRALGYVQMDPNDPNPNSYANSGSPNDWHLDAQLVLPDRATAVELSYTLAGRSWDVTTSGAVKDCGATPAVLDPAAAPDEATTRVGQKVNVPVLINDTRLVKVTSVDAATPVGSGVATVAAGGLSVEFAPAAGFVGDATFAYTGTDANGATASSTAKVTVTPDVVTPPVATPEPTRDPVAAVPVIAPTRTTVHVTG